MIFMTGESNAPKIQFVISCANVIFDTKNNQTSWNGVQRSAAGPEGDGWSAEVALAFKDLEVSPSSADVRWIGNFMHDWDQLRAGYATWAVASTGGGETTFGRESLFGTLVFGGENAAVRLMATGDLTAGRVDAQVAGGSLAKQVAFRLTAEGAPPQEKTLALASQTPARFEAAAPLGKPSLLAITATDASNQELLVFDQPFTARPAIVLTYACRPERRQIEVKLDLGNLDDDSRQAMAKETLKGELQLADAEGKEVRSCVSIAPKASPFAGGLPFPAKLVPGKYLVRATLTNPKGGTSTQQKLFEVPPDDFLKSKSGLGHDVPDPWTPVAVEGDRLKVLNREYRLGASPFPVGIASLGEELLRGPVEWVVTTAKGEERIVWKSFKVVEKQTDLVRIETQGTLPSSGTRVSCTARLEFDGLWFTTVTLDPGSSPLEIKSMHLEYAVPARSAQYVLAPLVRPWENDRVLLDLFQGIDQPAGNPQYCMGGFWLTGMKTGLYFFTPTDGNWVCQADKPNVRVSRQADRCDVRVLLIHKPTVLRKPAAYQFGMMGTPLKPRPPRDITFSRRIKPTEPPLPPNLIGGTHDWIFQGGKWQNWISLVNLQPEALDASLKPKRELGTRYFFQYSCPTAITGDNPYEDFWGPTWRCGNTYVEEETYSCCSNSSFSDLLAYYVENLARDHGVGPYFDMSGVAWCDNRAHGCGYDDVFGRAARTTSVMGFREECMRIYRVAHRHGCRVWHHNHSQFVMPAQIFTDIWFPGEQYSGQMAGKMEHFYTQLPRTDYQVEMNPFLRGVSMVFLPQYGRSADLFGDKHTIEEWHSDAFAWASERLLTMLLPHDIEFSGAYMCPTPGVKVEDVYKQKGVIDPLGRKAPRAAFTGYWDNPKLTAGDPELLMSYYTFPGEARVLAVLSNPTLKERTTVLKFDPKDFGLPADYRVRDEYRNEDLTVAAAKGIPMPPENFRLLSIEPSTSIQRVHRHDGNIFASSSLGKGWWEWATGFLMRIWQSCSGGLCSSLRTALLQERKW